MPYSKKYSKEEIRIMRRDVNRRYSKTHKEQEKIKQKSWRDRHIEEQREKGRKQQKLRRINNPEQVRLYSRNRKQEIKKEMVAAYGGVCSCCGETEITFLTLDHTFGDGAVHRREIAAASAKENASPTESQATIIRQLRAADWPQDGRFRILCWNCQWGTRRPNGCPHIRPHGF